MKLKKHVKLLNLQKSIKNFHEKKTIDDVLACFGEGLYECPSHPHQHYRRCIKTNDLCNGVVDCPGEEDESPTNCLFYKVVSFIKFYKVIACFINYKQISHHFKRRLISNLKTKNCNKNAETELKWSKSANLGNGIIQVLMLRFNFLDSQNSK